MAVKKPSRQALRKSVSRATKTPSSNVARKASRQLRKKSDGYADAAVLTADFGGVVGLAKIVGIAGSYISLLIFVALMCSGPSLSLHSQVRPCGDYRISDRP